MRDDDPDQGESLPALHDGFVGTCARLSCSRPALSGHFLSIKETATERRRYIPTAECVVVRKATPASRLFAPTRCRQPTVRMPARSSNSPVAQRRVALIATPRHLGLFRRDDGAR